MRKLAATSVLIAALLATGVPHDTCRAAEPDYLRADQLKATYLFNFARFVEWPTNIGDVFQICFIGAMGVRDSLARATADKRVGVRPVVVRELTDVAAADFCAIIYVDAQASSHGERLQLVIRSAALTVSDVSGFTQSGGTIELYTEDNRLRFIVNVENARRAGACASARTC